MKYRIIRKKLKKNVLVNQWMRHHAEWTIIALRNFDINHNVYKIAVDYIGYATVNIAKLTRNYRAKSVGKYFSEFHVFTKYF